MTASDGVVLMGVKGGPSVLPRGSMPTSSLVRLAGQEIVLDCGLGVTRGLVAQGMRLAELRTILVTHLHSDHYLELGPLIHTAWTSGLKGRVTVHGPAGLAGYWRAFLQSMRDDIELRIADEARPDLAGLVDVRLIEEGTVIEEAGLHVSALANRHPPLVESYAIAFEAEGSRIVFSGDTAPFAGFTAFAAGADLLVHEAMLASGIERIVARLGLGDKLRRHFQSSHTLAEDAGRIAAEAGVRALALHHFVPGDDPLLGPADWEKAVRQHYAGPLFIGRDGLQIRLADIARAS
jgi:ribonuclease BN (tRNA processing enzyme)